MARHRQDGFSRQIGAGGRSWAWRRMSDAVIVLAALALALPLIVLGA